MSPGLQQEIDQRVNRLSSYIRCTEEAQFKPNMADIHLPMEIECVAGSFPLGRIRNLWHATELHPISKNRYRAVLSKYLFSISNRDIAFELPSSKIPGCQKL